MKSNLFSLLVLVFLLLTATSCSSSNRGDDPIIRGNFLLGDSLGTIDIDYQVMSEEPINDPEGLRDLIDVMLNKSDMGSSLYQVITQKSSEKYFVIKHRVESDRPRVVTKLTDTTHIQKVQNFSDDVYETLVELAGGVQELNIPRSIHIQDTSFLAESEKLKVQLVNRIRYIHSAKLFVSEKLTGRILGSFAVNDFWVEAEGETFSHVIIDNTEPRNQATTDPVYRSMSTIAVSGKTDDMVFYTTTCEILHGILSKHTHVSVNDRIQTLKKEGVELSQSDIRKIEAEYMFYDEFATHYVAAAIIAKLVSDGKYHDTFDQEGDYEFAGIRHPKDTYGELDLIFALRYPTYEEGVRLLNIFFDDPRKIEDYMAEVIAQRY